MSVKNEILKLITIKNSNNIVDKFCREQFQKYFSKKSNQVGMWQTYENFELIDEKNIRINYRCGVGDTVFHRYFTVKVPNDM